MKYVIVLGDQLNFDVSTLAEPASTTIVMIESMKLANAMPHHKQKLVHVFSAMRHFAKEARERGFSVAYYEAEKSFKSGFEAFYKTHSGVALVAMMPNDRPYADAFTQWATELGGSFQTIPNELWITTHQQFDTWADGRKSLRLEYFYREMRRAHGYLMDGDSPVGGEWNYDDQNRGKPPKGYTFSKPEPPAIDDVTQEIIDFVEQRFPDHFGTTDHFAWPVTRDEALAALDHFCRHRLKDFGVYEDAMLQDEGELNHSLLSPLINVGLLHPREVIDRAIETYRSDDIPTNSIEGFVRQILGWREFMFHIYRTNPTLRDVNELDHHGGLPSFYWSGETDMNCISQSVNQLKRTGYNHHIQRLMILGNFAMMMRVDPEEVFAWFSASYIDALEWVMVPNVMGMSQFADGGEFTSKPYAASANYVHKMSDYCKHCTYDRKDRTGENACPFNAAYWGFIGHHEARFSNNGRMNMIMANWRKLDLETRDALVEKYEALRREFEVA